MSLRKIRFFTSHVKMGLDLFGGSEKAFLSDNSAEI